MNNMELETDIEALDMEMGDITIHYCPVIPNPEGEPTAELKTADIEGTIYKIVDEEARTELENKVDKEEGKGLSENDYTDEDKAIVDGVTTALNGKVDKDGDKVLSDNNYSDEDKAIVVNTPTALDGKADKSNTYTKTETDNLLLEKANTSDLSTVATSGSYNDLFDTPNLSTVATSGDYDDLLNKPNLSTVATSGSYDDLTDKPTIDTAISPTSTNAVENRVVKSALDEKLNADETAVNSNGLVIATPVTDTAPYIYRQTPVKESFKALMHKIVGASVVWNQLVQNGNFVDDSNWSLGDGFSSISVSNNVLTATFDTTNNLNKHITQRVSLIANHKYLCFADISSSAITTYKYLIVDTDGNHSYTSTSKFAFVHSQTVSDTTAQLRIGFVNSYAEGTGTIKNVMLIDLTAMFGTTIADYVYTLETSQSGSGIAWLQSYGFFTEDYYAYKQNKLESGCVSAKKIVGKNLFDKTRAVVTSSASTSWDYARNDGGILLFEGVTYTLSIGKTISSMGAYYYGGNTDSSNRIGYATSTNTLTFTPTKTTKVFIRLYSNTASGGISQSDIDTVQLEIGSTATSFESYAPTTYPIEPITIRGLFGVSDGKLTVNGDEYNADGSVTRKYEQRAYQSGDESLANAITDGTNTIVKLATPTTEQTTPFTETEIVGSTEEFIDYGVAQNTRDVAIPIGTDTDYYQEMKLPSLPTTSGNHNLIYNVATGFGWS